MKNWKSPFPPEHDPLFSRSDKWWTQDEIRQSHISPGEFKVPPIEPFRIETIRPVMPKIEMPKIERLEIPPAQIQMPEIKLPKANVPTRFKVTPMRGGVSQGFHSSIDDDSRFSPITSEPTIVDPLGQMGCQTRTWMHRQKSTFAQPFTDGIMIDGHMISDESFSSAGWRSSRPAEASERTSAGGLLSSAFGLALFFFFVLGALVVVGGLLGVAQDILGNLPIWLQQLLSGF